VRLCEPVRVREYPFGPPTTTLGVSPGGAVIVTFKVPDSEGSVDPLVDESQPSIASAQALRARPAKKGWRMMSSRDA
jgi:hypothetical protein